jgi:hypothetical protein
VCEGFEIKINGWYLHLWQSEERWWQHQDLLGEDHALARENVVFTEADAIFKEEVSLDIISGKHVKELSGVRIIVRCSKSTRPVYIKDS